MENLTVFEHRGVQVVDSRQVAKAIERPHRDLLKTIRTYCAYIAENNGGANDTNGRNFSLVEFFIESSYGDEKNQERPCYLLTKKGLRHGGEQTDGTQRAFVYGGLCDGV